MTWKKKPQEFQLDSRREMKGISSVYSSFLYIEKKNKKNRRRVLVIDIILSHQEARDRAGVFSMDQEGVSAPPTVLLKLFGW